MDNIFERYPCQLVSNLLKDSRNPYRPIEQSLLERALTAVKKVAKVDRDLGLEWTGEPYELISKFCGFIGEQVVKACLTQWKPVILSAINEPNDPIEIRLPHDIELETVKGKRVKVEIKTIPPTYKHLTINKRSWSNQAMKHGTPDYVIAVLLKGQKIRIHGSENLDSALESLEKWVESYQNQLSAEMMGWLEGSTVERLNDSEKMERLGLWTPCKKRPSWHCELDSDWLKPMNEFWRMFIR